MNKFTKIVTAIGLIAAFGSTSVLTAIAAPKMAAATKSTMTKAPKGKKTVMVKAHTRTLKSGKVVTVKAHPMTVKTTAAPKPVAVKGYTKTTKSGKVIHVKGYNRKAPKAKTAAPKM